MRTKVAIVLLLLGLTLLCALLAWHVSGPRLVAQAVAPDGTEFFVVQRCNWSGEPFTTGFHYRTPAGQWGWCYYDHQDDYWGRGQVIWDEQTNRATIMRKGKPAITFDWKTETYVLLRWNRTNVGAQSWSPSGTAPKWWTPELAKQP